MFTRPILEEISCTKCLYRFVEELRSYSFYKICRIYSRPVKEIIAKITPLSQRIKIPNGNPAFYSFVAKWSESFVPLSTDLVVVIHNLLISLKTFMGSRNS